MSVLTVLGDVLLDCDLVGTADRLSPDAPVPVVDEQERTLRAGGAGLAASLAAAAGHRVRLITALGDDEPAHRLRDALRCAGVEVVALPAGGETRQKTRIRVAGQSLLRLDRGRAEPTGRIPDGVEEALADSDAVLVADYGCGLTSLSRIRTMLQRAARHRPVVWDPHPRGPRPVPGTALATPNETEAAQAAHARRSPATADRLTRTVSIADRLCADWQTAGVSVTLGAIGAVLGTGSGSPLVVPAPPVDAVDPCGAGDCFAATATAALAEGAVLSEAVIAAVRAASAYVAGNRPGAGTDARAPEPAAGSAIALAQTVRGGGGTVVVAGGCFDLLHQGHVELLTAARRLGDCLIVALNSDASIHRLKGAGRPIIPATERAAVLRALRSVDDVLVFEDPTPMDALRRLRPHLFVKGGDYAGIAIEEQAVLDQWGAQVVTVPYLPEHSTTRIVKGVRHG